MAPPKIYKWPAYVFTDPAVLKLDELGRFIICRLCAEYYAACGGKKPKPIVLSGRFRTRAWEVHKQRTRAHNTNEMVENTSATPVDTAMDTPTANSPQSFCGMLAREASPMNAALRPSLASSFAPLRAPNQPPRHNRRLPLRPFPGSNSAARSQHAGASAESCRRHRHQTTTRLVQPSPSLQLTLVFPLVREPSALRDWSNFDPACCRSCPGYDWRRRPSSRPSFVSQELRTKSRSRSPRNEWYTWPRTAPNAGAPNEASIPEKDQSKVYVF